MTYEELVKMAKESYCTKDASNIKEHVAIQFNVVGEGEGIFYLEIKDGKVYVEPYEYYDRDAIVITSAENLVAMAEGTLGMESAYFSGKIKAEGDLGKALLLKTLSPKKQAKVAAKKAATAKKATAAKKPAAEKKTAPAKKVAPAKKAPAAKKTTEKKA